VIVNRFLLTAVCESNQEILTVKISYPYKVTTHRCIENVEVKPLINEQMSNHPHTYMIQSLPKAVDNCSNDQEILFYYGTRIWKR